jgi:hypothetical protein
MGRAIATSRRGQFYEGPRDRPGQDGLPLTASRRAVLDVPWFDIRPKELKSLRLQDEEASRYLLQPGDFLIC